MEPMTIALLTSAGVQLASSLAQWYNSEQGKKATQEERAKVDALINNLQMPNFDIRDLQPEDYQVIARYEPRFVRLVKEAEPKLLEKTGEARQARSSQMDVLGQLRELARTGEDPLTALAKVKAMRETGRASQAQQQSMDALLQRRGLGLDSGTALAMSNAANAQALDRMGMMGMQDAADAYNRRAQAMGNQASLAGNIFNAEMDQEGRNVNTINAFNQRMADIQNEQNLRNSDIYNQAMYRQQDVNQDIFNKNTATRNQADESNRAARNQAQQAMYNAQLGKLNAQVGQSGARVGDITDFTRDDNQRMQGAGDFASGVAYTVGKNWKEEPAKPAPQTPYPNYVEQRPASPAMDQMTDKAVGSAYNNPYEDEQKKKYLLPQGERKWL